MTTIAYKNDIIAVDSMASSGGTITDINYNKIIKNSGVTFIICGTLSDAREIINAYFGKKYNKKADIWALVCDGGRVFDSGISTQGRFYKLDITGNHYALGSGSDHALTAMDLGLSAKEAVKMASKRDTCTGGRIRIHRVKSTVRLKRTIRKPAKTGKIPLRVIKNAVQKVTDERS